MCRGRAFACDAAAAGSIAAGPANMSAPATKAAPIKHFMTDSLADADDQITRSNIARSCSDRIENKPA